jgi:hypothetical protein
MTPEETLEMVRREPRKAAKLLCDLNGAVDALQHELKKRDHLIARLSKNSSNSSKPPSSDIVKPANSQTRPKTRKRKIGGQPGHARNERLPFDKD